MLTSRELRNMIKQELVERGLSDRPKAVDKVWSNFMQTDVDCPEVDVEDAVDATYFNEEN